MSKRKCDTFKARTDQCKLIDLRFSGHRFTWGGPIFHGGKIIYERINRDLSNYN